IRTAGGLEAVLDPSELGAHIEPGRRSLPDTDLEPTRGGLETDLPGIDLSHDDAPVCGAGGHARPGLVDVDVPVGRHDIYVPDHFADPRFPVEVLDLRLAVDAPDRHLSGGADLGVPITLFDAQAPRPAL